MEPYRAASVVQMSIFSNNGDQNEQTDADEIRKKTERQVENTSAGGHLGGTYFGQQPDGKTASSSSAEARKSRPNDGSN
jgi:hypothetical protein